MARRDMASLVRVVPIINPGTAPTDNTAIVSAVFDMAGFQSATVVIQSGSLADADATFTVLLEDGDAANLSDNAPVADQYLVGTEAAASFTFANDNAIRKLGYVGPKRYGRLTITPAGNASAANFSALVILGDPARAPVA